MSGTMSGGSGANTVNPISGWVVNGGDVTVTIHSDELSCDDACVVSSVMGKPE